MGTKNKRVSVGRNERKSLLQPNIDTSDLTAFYKDIPKNLAADARLTKLLEDAFEYSINKLDSSAGVGSVLTGKQMKAYGREALGTWLEEHKKAVEMACERMPLQQNPKNKEMKANLELYRNTKRRLDDEMKIWDEVEGSVKRRAVGHDSTSNKSAKSALSASDKAILKEAAAVVKDLESSISDEVEDIQIGVEKLEEFVTGNSLQLKAAEKHARDLKGDLGKDAFSDFPFIGSPQKLLKAISKKKKK